MGQPAAVQDGLRVPVSGDCLRMSIHVSVRAWFSLRIRMAFILACLEPLMTYLRKDLGEDQARPKVSEHGSLLRSRMPGGISKTMGVRRRKGKQLSNSGSSQPEQARGYGMPGELSRRAEQTGTGWENSPDVLKVRDLVRGKPHLPAARDALARLHVLRHRIALSRAHVPSEIGRVHHLWGQLRPHRAVIRVPVGYPLRPSELELLPFKVFLEASRLLGVPGEGRLRQGLRMHGETERRMVQFCGRRHKS